ncbi:MAG: phosphatidylserine decarboxylase family protein [Gemmataceae bacterium]
MTTETNRRPEQATEAVRLQPHSIESIQPGGGVVMALELAWGRLRRWYLRRFRPRYVEKMLARRQGVCPRCSHDIVDTRDLKYFRNVCGYFFAPQDDPFAWRDRLGLARAGLAEIVASTLLLTGCVASAVLFLPRVWAAVAVTLLAALWGFVLWFFRDPDRTVPQDPGVVVSPADGTVTHVDIGHEPGFAEAPVLRISIFLSIFDVHVNRVPAKGRVVCLAYYPGRFGNALSDTVSRTNEQLWIDLQTPEGLHVRVKQIAGAIARRIVCWLRPGEEVEAGQRFGMIKFGSRTDLLLPAQYYSAAVEPGQRVYGGTSVVARRHLTDSPTHTAAGAS